MATTPSTRATAAESVAGIAVPTTDVLFISHSSLDKELVKSLVDVLLCSALSAQQIVCSSVEGCTLPSGVPISNT
ncbi:MAG: hypothetical protein ACRD3J_04595, partial [Thermoanaerobaculia bacterium]